MRQRVRDQLHRMAPGEYDNVRLGIRLFQADTVSVPTLADSSRVQRICLPEQPTVGEVVALAVEGEHGCILRFEMQATRGSGRIVPLGSIQGVMRESIEAATQFIRANAALHIGQPLDCVVEWSFMKKKWVHFGSTLGPVGPLWVPYWQDGRDMSAR
jgi:ATP-dependent Lon protease